MPAPRFLGYQALLGEPKPINWQGVGQALWDSNLNAPIRGAYNLMNADPYTLYTDTGAAGQQAATDSFDAAGGVTVGSMPIPKPSNSLTMGIKAYHGSPHSFDKFSMDKIGTGEGAQAYGHGLYFAENEGVARGYRKALEKGNPTITVGDQHILDVHDNLMATGEMDKARAIEFLADGGDASYVNGNAQYMTPETLDWFNKEIAPQIKRDGGSMYEVNIDADPNAFLDWDKPLSEQPEGVRKAYAQAVAGGDPLLSELMDGSTESLQMAGLFKKSSGAQAYNTFVDGNKEGFTKKLADAGIPGIKYLDAGSRGAGDGTRNYVVFDDKIISIVKKYGIAGASAMLGYDVLTGANEAQAKAVNKADLDHRYDNFLKSGGI
jgi:hypothetical protein